MAPVPYPIKTAQYRSPSKIGLRVYCSSVPHLFLLMSYVHQISEVNLMFKLFVPCSQVTDDIFVTATSKKNCCNYWTFSSTELENPNFLSPFLPPLVNFCLFAKLQFFPSIRWTSFTIKMLCKYLHFTLLLQFYIFYRIVFLAVSPFPGIYQYDLLISDISDKVNKISAFKRI